MNFSEGPLSSLFSRKISSPQEEMKREWRKREEISRGYANILERTIIDFNKIDVMLAAMHAQGQEKGLFVLHTFEIKKGARFPDFPERTSARQRSTLFETAAFTAKGPYRSMLKRLADTYGFKVSIEVPHPPLRDDQRAPQLRVVAVFTKKELDADFEFTRELAQQAGDIPYSNDSHSALTEIDHHTEQKRPETASHRAEKVEKMMTISVFKKWIEDTKAGVLDNLSITLDEANAQSRSGAIDQEKIFTEAANLLRDSEIILKLREIAQQNGFDLYLEAVHPTKKSYVPSTPFRDQSMKAEPDIKKMKLIVRLERRYA